MTTILNTRVRNKLIRKLLAEDLSSPGIRAITGWTAPKMSLRLALASIAKAENLVLFTSWAEDTEGRNRLWFRFADAATLIVAAAPKAKAAANSNRKAAAVAEAPKRSARRTA